MTGNFAGFSCDGDGTCLLQVSRIQHGYIPGPVFSLHLFQQSGSGFVYLEERPAPELALVPFYVRAHRLYDVTRLPGSEFEIRALP